MSDQPPDDLAARLEVALESGKLPDDPELFGCGVQTRQQKPATISGAGLLTDFWID